MYQIKQNGSVIGYSDDVIFVRLHENGRLLCESPG